MLRRSNPSLFVKKGSEISLSGASLLHVLCAVLERKAEFRFRAKGFSMSPFIRNDDILTVKPILSEMPKAGDVVAFVHPKTQSLSVHRIIKEKGNFFSIKGDNSFASDGLIPLSNILGQVKEVERNKKKVFLGMGPERRMIAFLGRSKIFLFFLFLMQKSIRFFIRGFKA